jgi:NADPH2:quinone reductase
MIRAVLCRTLGEPEGLDLTDLPPPGPLGPGQVRVAVHAAGINFADTLMIAGAYQVKPELPFVPGLEAAGIVTEVAPDVATVEKGDRVVSLLDHGGFAEEAVAAAHDVFPIPDGMDFETAAGFPIAYGTSHLALYDRARLLPRETLVVHGAAGGVGLTAVEIGKAMGATVIATASGPEKLAVAASRGADHLVDYTREDTRARILDLTEGKGADVIYDPVGGDVFDLSLRCVNWGARLLIIGFAEGRIPQIPANILLVKNLSAIGLHFGSYRRRSPRVLKESFRTLFRWFEEGKIRPHVSHRLPFDEVTRGLRLLKARKSTGKVVLTTGRTP